MSPAGASRLVGSVRWAIAPYAPQPPFRLYAGENRPPITAGTKEIIAASREGGDTELTYLVPAKVRPILIVADPPVGHLREVLALRLLRLHRLRSEERDLVRRQRHSRFFHLSPERFALPEESAAMVTALLRVHVDACASESLGTLGADDRAILGERIIRHYGFDPQLADRARR